ncbi:MAG: YheT family hydrolase [Nitrospinales bacterium]
MPDSIRPFEAHPLIQGGFLQTAVGSQLSGKTVLPTRVRHKLKVGPNAVLMLLELESTDEVKPIVLLAHGMGGCSESSYMRRIARKLWEEGCGVFMMNHRGSGPGMGMCDTLWNGGVSDDLEKAVHYIAETRSFRTLLLVGFSLSGNIVLKYLGEGRKIPTVVAGAFAVNPPIDLKAASLLLSRSRRNRVFNWYYMSLLHRQAAAMAQCFPNALRPPANLKTIWDFDAAYTAPAAGYKDAEEYYSRCSSNQFLENIEVPATLLCARDDPFIPPELFEKTPMSEAVSYIAPDQGGHMGYLARHNGGSDRRWMDYVVVNWARRWY